VFDRTFFEELPLLLEAYRERWDVALCVKIVKADEEELLVAETLVAAERWIALVHFPDADADARCPAGGRSDEPLPVAVLGYEDIESVRLLASTPDGARAFGFRTRSTEPRGIEQDG
jgi:hypothetical protein